MNEVWHLIQQGGPVMYALLLLSLVMYEACLHRLFKLTRLRWRLHRTPDFLGRDGVGMRALETELRLRFAHDEVVIGSLVAAAPLLGLLGTVMGMVATFDTLSAPRGLPASSGLAEGISMALITTETGLAVAIPAVVLMYYARRQLQRVARRLGDLEERARNGP